MLCNSFTLKRGYMKFKVNNSLTENKDLVYTESFWTGKKEVEYDGNKAEKVDKFTFKLGEDNFNVMGSYMTGVTIGFKGNNIEMVKKTTWFEYTLALLTFIGCLAFAFFVNNVWCAVVCGVFGGFGCVCSLYVMKLTNKTWLKILIGFAFLLVLITLSYVFSAFVFKAL